MDTTSVTAHLPMADIEITRRALPEQDAETITIHITAVPSFDALAHWLFQTSVFPMASAFGLWAEMMRAWQPWLPASAEAFRSLSRPE